MRSYLLTILQWDANHAFWVALNQQELDEDQAQGVTAPFAFPIIVGNALVAVNGFLFRYNGASWVLDQGLVVQSPEGGSQQRYAYGTDYALQVVTSPNGTPVQATVLGFDPTFGSSEWNASPYTWTLTDAQNTWDDYPSATDDYAAVGANVFFRGTAADWTGVFSSPAQRARGPGRALA